MPASRPPGDQGGRAVLGSVVLGLVVPALEGRGTEGLVLGNCFGGGLEGVAGAEELLQARHRGGSCGADVTEFLSAPGSPLPESFGIAAGGIPFLIDMGRVSGDLFVCVWVLVWIGHTNRAWT